MIRVLSILLERIKIFLGIILIVGKQPWVRRCNLYDEDGQPLLDVFKVDRWSRTIWYYERKDGKFYLNAIKDGVVYSSRKCDFTIEGIPSICGRVLTTLKLFIVGRI